MPKTPKPISLSTIIRKQHTALVAALTRGRTDSASVELTRNAKGDTQIKVSVDGETVDEASARAQATYDALAAKYPGPTA